MSLSRLARMGVNGISLIAFGLLAQTPTATLVGTVFDATGAVVAGASLEVRNSENNQRHTAQSDAKGEFTILDLAPGRYEVEIVKDAFRSVHETNLVLEMEQTARMEFRLEPGAVSQSITVDATVPLLNTENGAKGEVLVTRQIVEMPLNGRDFSNLALLVPGVLPSAPG
ncbi:MAG: carboxypeptidase-like regulatory domain-containing protein, partial [Acidobacteriota bacterium]|nr:carboxypeptidase-like regulatory domain-containing protein [Acidobacteriota bacterium]